MDDELTKLVDAKCRELGEHFDSVQIFVQHTDQGETNTYKTGSGSWHARIGMCYEMTQMNEARNFLQVKKTEFDNTEKE